MKAVDEHARVTGIWCGYVGQEAVTAHSSARNESWVTDGRQMDHDSNKTKCASADRTLYI
jgi:hypothetical protein